MTYDVPFLRHVTSNKTRFLSYFLTSSILYRLISTLVHTLLYYGSYKNCTNKNNVTRISMATKYPIIKDRALRIHNLAFFISTNNEDISQKFWPDTYAHINVMTNWQISDNTRSKVKVIPRTHCLARCCYISLIEPDNFFIILFIDTSRDTLSDKWRQYFTFNVGKFNTCGRSSYWWGRARLGIPWILVLNVLTQSKQLFC